MNIIKKRYTLTGVIFPDYIFRGYCELRHMERVWYFIK
jgi:hypothetical protein